jgi:hypothetical protein
MTDFQSKITEVVKRRKQKEDLIRRRVVSGYIKGEVRPSGAVVLYGTKGIQNWYSTRELKILVTERMDRNEKICGKRICHINGRWMLQIRGKHLRRLIKAMPNVKQVGRTLVEL